MKVNISITIDEKLAEKLKRGAEDSNRNLSNHIETLLINATK